MRSIELFCGTGGLALGLQMSGFHHEAVFEWDKNSCDNLRYNMANGYPGIQGWSIRQKDVRAVDYSAFSGVQFVSGGPPCQPFSLGGKHQAYHDKRDMFPEAVRAVREIRPRAFLFENVKGLLRKSFSSYFHYILLQLRYPEIENQSGASWEEHLSRLERYHTAGNHDGLCYNVVFRLLNAADYGVPQIRHRVIIVGFRSDFNANWCFPRPTHSREALLYAKWVSGSYWEELGVPRPKETPLSPQRVQAVRRVIEDSDAVLPRWRTVRDAIGDLPDPRGARSSHTVYNHEFREGAKSYAGHSGSGLDEPSKAIKAGAHGVPGGENTVILDDGTVRYYTIRESARIQTFPDDYLFSASWTESMRQIGNAVPVKLAKAVGDSVIEQMERVVTYDKERGYSDFPAV